jgi:Cu+-exporting ATPase
MSEKKYSIDDIINEIKENKISEEELEQYEQEFEKFNTTALLDDILGRDSENVLDGIDLDDNGLTPEENAQADQLLAEILAADQKEEKPNLTFSAQPKKRKRTPKPLKPLTPVDERPASPLKMNPAMKYAVHMDDMTRMLSKEDLEREAERFRARRSLSSRPFEPYPAKKEESQDQTPTDEQPQQAVSKQEPVQEEKHRLLFRSKTRAIQSEEQTVEPETKPAAEIQEEEVPQQTETPVILAEEIVKPQPVSEELDSQKESESTASAPEPETEPEVQKEETPAVPDETKQESEDEEVSESEEQQQPAEEELAKSEMQAVTTRIFRPVDAAPEPDTIEINRLGDLPRAATPKPQPKELAETELPGQLNLLTHTEVPFEEEQQNAAEVGSTTTEIRVGPLDVANSVSERSTEGVLDDPARLKYIALRKNREGLVKDFALDPDAVNTASIPSVSNETLQQEIENADISIDTSGTKKSPLMDSPLSVEVEREDVPLFSASEEKKARHIGSQKVNEWKEKVTEHIRAESDEEPDEYQSYSQAEDVRAMLSEMHHGILFRLVGCFFVFLLSLGLLWINQPEEGAMIPLLDAAINPMIYCVVNLALMILLFAFSFDVVRSGIVSLFQKSPNRTTMYAIALIFLLVFSAVLLTYPEIVNEKNVHVYIPLLAFCMGMMAVGRLQGVKRVEKNFELVCEQGDHFSADIVENQELAEDITKGALNDYPMLVCNRKTPFLADFLNESFSEDVTDKQAKYLVGIVCVIALIVGVAALFRGNDLYGALSAFTGVLIVGAGASTLLVVNAPLSRASKELSRTGGTVLGYNAAETYRDVNSVLVSANDLFEKDDVTLYGIKTFSNMAIDRAILDATSVLCETKSILSPIFMKIISDRTDYLDPVDTVIYEDGMGISAWVKDRRVLIGSRELMINHNIDVPSRDYEDRYIAQDRNLIYLSAAGELSAVFVVGLSCNENIRNMLVDLYNDDIAVIVKSVDPILTKAQLAKVFEMPEDTFRVIPSRLHKECEQMEDTEEPVNGAVVDNGTFVSYIRSLLAAKRLYKTISVAQLFNFVSIGVGVLFFIAFTAMDSISQLSNLTLCIYELVFVVLTLLGQRFRKLIP